MNYKRVLILPPNPYNGGSDSCPICKESNNGFRQLGTGYSIESDVNHMLGHNWVIISAGVATKKYEKHETEMTALMGEPADGNV